MLFKQKTIHFNFRVFCCHTATNFLKRPVYGRKLVAAGWQMVAAK